MAYIHTVDIVEEIVTEFLLGLNGSYDNLLDNGSSYTITLCKTYHLRLNSQIIISGNTYTVQSISGNDVTITGTPAPPTSGTVVFPSPFYFHDTPISLNNTLQQIEDTVNKFPMIYLYEWLRDQNDYSGTQQVYRRTRLRMFFLDEINFQDWDTEEKYKQTLQPQANLAEEFLQFLKNHRYINIEFGQVDLLPMNYFNPTIKQNGQEKNLFSEPLAGVEVQLELPFNRNVLICKKC